MRTKPTIARGLLLAALALPTLLAACEGMKNPLGPDPNNMEPGRGDFVQTAPLETPEFGFLWERAKFMLQTDGYGIDGSRTDLEERRIVSQWNTILSPSRYHGRRRRVTIEFEEAPAGRWIANVAVLVQRNEDIEDPLQIARAVWKEDAPDTQRANVLVYKLEAGFGALEREDEEGGAR